MGDLPYVFGFEPGSTDFAWPVGNKRGTESCKDLPEQQEIVAVVDQQPRAGSNY